MANLAGILIAGGALALSGTDTHRAAFEILTDDTRHGIAVVA